MLSALINIVLDAVFIPVFGMGVEGAAYATGIAYTITTGVLCLHFFTPEAKCRFTRAIGAWKEVGQACWNGVSELINETSIGLVILFINWILLARIGSYGVAAFTIINYAAWFGASVSYAISDSLSPLVSANFGAGTSPAPANSSGLPWAWSSVSGSCCMVCSRCIRKCC